MFLQQTAGMYVSMRIGAYAGPGFGMKPRILLHVIADAHIYDRHVPMIEDLISRTPFPAPKIYMNRI